MSNDKSQPTQVSVIFNAENCLKISESGYLKACGNDMQKVADTIVSFGVSRWAALSKHSESKGRGPLIPGERKTRGGSGTPSTPRKPKEAGAAVTRGSVEAELAAMINGKANDKQTSIPGSDTKADTKADKPTESKGKETNGRVVHDKPSKEWLRQQAAEKAKEAAAAQQNGAAKPPKAETKATAAPAAPKPSKGAAKAPKEWVITYNPRRQTCCVPQEDAKSEADAREYAVREFKVDPKKILHVALQAEA